MLEIHYKLTFRNTLRILVWAFICVPLHSYAVTINDVNLQKVGPKNSKIIFKMDHPHKFQIEKAPNKVLLHLPKSTEFKTFNSKSFKNPHVRGYKVFKDHVAINLKPGTKFSSSELNEEGGDHRLILHFTNDDSIISGAKTNAGAAFNQKSIQEISLKPKKPKPLPPAPFSILTFDIQGTDKETLFTISSNRAHNFKFIEEKDKKTVHIFIPKGSLQKSTTLSHRGGIIESFSAHALPPQSNRVTLKLNKKGYVSSATALPTEGNKGGIFVLSLRPIPSQPKVNEVKKKLPLKPVKHPLKVKHAPKLDPSNSLVSSLARKESKNMYTFKGNRERMRSLRERRSHTYNTVGGFLHKEERKSIKPLSFSNAKFESYPAPKSSPASTLISQKENLGAKKQKKPTSSIPSPSVGLYIGSQAGFGFGPYNLKQKFYGYVTNVNEISTADFSQLMVNFGANGFVGFGVPIGRLYIGAEFSAGYYNAKSNMQRPAEFGLTLERIISSSMSHGYQSLLRVGFLPTPSTLLYIKAGHAYTNFKHTSSVFNLDRLDYPISFNKNIHGIAFGGGMETALTSNFSLRFDIFHLRNKNIKSTIRYKPIVNNSFVGTEHAIMTPNYNRADLGFTYRFTPFEKVLPPAERSSIKTGFYAAGFYHQGFMQNLREDFVPSNHEKTHDAASTFQHGYGGSLGLSFLISQLFFAVESHYSPLERKLHQVVQQTGGVQSSGDDSFTNSLKSSWHNALRLGWLVNPKTILYGKFGHVNSTFKHTPSKSEFQRTHNSTIAIDFSKSVHGIILGVGAEVFLAGHVSLRLEFLHEHFGKLTISDPTLPGTKKEILSPETYDILLGLSITI